MKKEIGILCHVSSLPSEYGVGDFGKEAYKFIDFLAKNNVDIWQILPLNQTGETNCPYFSNCCFSYEEMFFDVDDLVKMKLITKADTLSLLALPKAEKVDYKNVKREKSLIFEKAYSNISKEMLAKLNNFLSQNEDVCSYATYRALLEKHNLSDWRMLDKNFLNPKSQQYIEFAKNNEQSILKYAFYQYVLDEQWKKLKAYANAKGVKILGDLPIYPNVLSFDVYANRDMYQLDKNYNMLCTGGVPKNGPDDIEQNWGSCVYDWKMLEKTDYAYIIKKINTLLDKFDILRLDHFYGYVEHYEYSTKNSKENKWVRAGGMDFFSKLSKRADINRIVVENLGFYKEICDKVMQKFKLTGMCLLLDMLKNEKSLPDSVEPNNIYYIGTHDNNTLIGYFNDLNNAQKMQFCKLLKLDSSKFDAKAIISIMQQMLNCKARMVVFQIQDLLMQDGFYRMNAPGTAFDQWKYKMPKSYRTKAEKTLKSIMNI